MSDPVETPGGEGAPNSKSAGSIHIPQTFLPRLLTIIAAKKEAKRLEKEAKLAAKVAKVSAATPAGEKKAKGEKEKKQAEEEFVNTTLKGEKKGESSFNTLSAYFVSHKRMYRRCHATDGQRVQPDRSRICLVRLVGRARLLQTAINSRRKGQT